jgi:hypothetical protein
VSGRRIRNLLLLALLGAAGYWYYRERPTLSELVDDITRPLLGSKAAVTESERKRVISDAASAIGQQTGENLVMLHENLSMSEVRDLLGEPDRTEMVSPRDPVRVRWTYRVVQRVVLFENGRVVSIAVL